LHVTKAQLAILPLPEGRQAERRIVNLAARLRDPGASISDIEVLNLSTSGFMAHGEVTLEPGTFAWLKLPGLEAQNCKLVWSKDGKAGFEFANPLHPATLELLVASGRKPIPRGHFGPQGGR
jgi:hypothetical protein